MYPVERQVRHQARLVDDLLDVSRITRGRIHLHRERLDLSQLVRDAIEDHRPVLEAAGLSLSLTLAKESATVDGDPTRLTQVLGNLLQNAAKFTDVGGQVTVRVAMDPEGDKAVVVVKDTGIGIEPAMLPRVFDTFAQADRTLHRSPGGLGLGLPVVKGLVELHGGSVSAASEGTGCSSEFVFWLPLALAPAMPRDAAHLPGAAGKAVRVLVVEDNRDVAETLRDLLELSGYLVEVVYSGPAGPEAARRFHPDVVLCHIDLPGMNGYAVAAALRQDPTTAAARLLAVSGYGQDEDRIRSRAAGFDQHLTKPLGLEELERLLTVTPKKT